MNSSFSWPLRLMSNCQPIFLTPLSSIRKEFWRVRSYRSCGWDTNKGTVLREPIGVLHRSWNWKSRETGKAWCYYKSSFSPQGNRGARVWAQEPAQAVCAARELCLHVRLAAAVVSSATSYCVTLVGQRGLSPISTTVSAALAFHDTNTVAVSPHRG